MTDFRRAETLAEVAAQMTVEPLKLGDPRYVDLSSGRVSTDLTQMQIHIQDQDARQNRFAKVAFIGHRGSGKSTELARLEHELAERFTPVHLFADEDLIGDFDYTDLLLWLAESVARHFSETEGLRPLTKVIVDGVAEWFAEKTIEDIKSVKAEVEATTEVEAKAKLGLPWLALGILAPLKSMVKSDKERRQSVRQRLRSYGWELVEKVNLLLDDAASVLEENERSPDLLIVQDNLDRLPGDVARRLYFDNGDLLKRLRAHIVFTVPIAMVLSPWNIGRVFENYFSMPMIKPHNRNGRKFGKGVDALVAVLEARVVIERVFKAKSVASFLARMSGGSVRDLIRLLNYAQLIARADGKEQIDRTSANRAVLKLRLDYERLLVPGYAYYPVLAQVHRTNQDPQVPTDSQGPEAVEQARAFLREMLFNGSVLEYNGEQCWYDVHPVITGIQAFQDALAALEQTGEPA